MQTSTTYWTLSPVNNGFVWSVDSRGYHLFQFSKAVNYVVVRPVVYLESDLSLSGEGTISNPYIIHAQ